MLMMMNGCIYTLYVFMCRWITFGWPDNYGAKVSKMHTVGLGGIVACDIFLIGGFSHV